MQIENLIIEENEDYVVVDKPATVSTVYDKTNSKSIQQLLEDKYKMPVHPVTRLDKVVSGVCLFARHKEAAAGLTELLKLHQIEKTYIAIVEGKVETPAGSSLELNHYIRKQGNKAKVSVDEQSNSKKAKLTYKTIAVLDNYSVLEVDLATGRYHQIRGQLALHGHCVKGDVKYGARRKNRDRSIHLHSWRLILGDQTYTSAVPDGDKLWETAELAIQAHKAD